VAWTAPKTWVTGDPLPASDLNTHVRDNFIFLHDQGPDIAGAASINTTYQFHKISSNVTINTIGVSGAPAGTRLVLWFSAGATITNAGNVELAGNVSWTASAGSTLSLISDGVKWHETARMVR
jgi:hypothetical protein